MRGVRRGRPRAADPALLRRGDLDVRGGRVLLAGARVLRDDAWTSPSRRCPQLRTALASRGVPSNDLPLAGRAFDLMDERELLRLNERVILDHGPARPGAGRGAPPGRGRASCTPPRRSCGPVVLQEGVRVEAGAVIVGPALLAAGAQIGRDAVVAQCLVGPQARCAAGTTIRHRLVLSGRETQSSSLPAYDPLLGLSHDSVALREDERPHVRPIRPGRRRRRACWPSSACSSCSPLLLLLAMLVKLDSRGPMLYGDKREGRGGRVFRCFKFRTMRVGADAHAARADGRRTRWTGRSSRWTAIRASRGSARMLRLISFDELPQLLNVALGPDEPGGAAALPVPREPDVHPLARGAAVGPSRHHRPLAGLPPRARRRATSTSGSTTTCCTSGTCRRGWISDPLRDRHHAGGKGHVPLSWIIPQSPVGGPQR